MVLKENDFYSYCRANYKNSFMNRRNNMKRIRLTARVILASSYKTLLNKLKREYPDLLKYAQKYKSGESEGFIFHHLNFESDKIFPNLNYKGDRKNQINHLNNVLDYSMLRTDTKRFEFVEKKYSPQTELEFLEIMSRLKNDKEILDKEMKDVVLIPKDFHGFIHSPKGIKLGRARNVDELYKQFLIYLESLSIDKLLNRLRLSGDSVSKSLDAIKRTTDFFLYRRRVDEAINIVDTAKTKAKHFLEDYKI